MKKAARTRMLTRDKTLLCNMTLVFTLILVGKLLNVLMLPCRSLLDALAGCIEPSSVKGIVLVDGQRRPKNFKFMTGYVVQVIINSSNNNNKTITKVLSVRHGHMLISAGYI